MLNRTATSKWVDPIALLELAVVEYVRRELTVNRRIPGLEGWHIGRQGGLYKKQEAVARTAILTCRACADSPSVETKRRF
jgi:hypothetical protein